jgi:hypothetical protein
MRVRLIRTRTGCDGGSLFWVCSVHILVQITLGVKLVRENVSADLLHQIARLSSSVSLSFTARR